MSALLLALAVAGGTLATYLFDEESPLPARVCMGAPLGLALLGLFGFLAASALGLGPAALVLATLLTLAPGAVVLATDRRRTFAIDARVSRDLLLARLMRPTAGHVALAVAGILAAIVVWRLYDRAMFLAPDGGIHTGVDHNIGDLPFHLAIITRFLHGENFPPEHPELSGVRLTYPFLVDFVTAMLMRAGTDLRDALFLVNVTLAMPLVALVYRWAAHVTRDRIAAVLTPLLVFLSGGLGFLRLLTDVDPTRGGLVGLLPRLAHDYTILSAGGLRWGNLFITMLLPQRSILFGLPLVIVIWTLWWQALGPEGDERRARRLMLGAGVITGLLPLVHAHAFAVTLAVAVVAALIHGRLRAWGAYLAAALVLSLPQVIWIARGSGLEMGRFFAWQVGWDRGDAHVVRFWLMNLGLFIPLLAVAFVRGRSAGWLDRRWLSLYLPLLGCFIVPNLVRLSPWIWDNIKFLVWWHVASAALLARLLAEGWRRRGGWRAATVAATVVLTASGGLDVWRVVSGTIDNRIYDGPAVAFGHRIRAVTGPDDIVLHAFTYNSEVYLAGRRSLLGYTGHTWSQGMDSGTREDDVRAMYAGGPEAQALLARHGIDYVLVGPREREIAGQMEDAFDGLHVVAEAGNYRLLRVAPKELE